MSQYKLKIFTKDLCPTCAELKTNLERIEQRIQVDYYNDIETNKALFEEYVIFKLPVTLLVKDDEEINRFYGAKSTEDISKFIQNEI